jgi:L-amino acid N-acyltransferase YncA
MGRGTKGDAMGGQEELKERYPKRLTLKDGRPATLRLMTAKDKEAVLEFARSLPEDDLLFLRTDITKPAIVDTWIDNVKKGGTVTLLAEIEKQLAAYASVHYNEARWTRNVGEIRINVGPGYRRTGLGRTLASEIFEVGRTLGLRKISAQMVTEQAAARAVFERLGFQVEARLPDWVEDRQGKPRDLLVMAYDLHGFTDQVEEPVRV